MKVFMLFVLCFLSMLSQDNIQKLNNYYDRLAKDGLFNGNVLIAEDGEIIFRRSIGVSNIEDGTKLTLQSKFRIGSVSKQFTAMAIMILKKQGKLNYSDKLVKYFPALPYDDVTIKHLLTHTGGLPAYEAMFRAHWDRSKIADNKALMQLLQTHKPKKHFKAGERWAYSNLGYVLLAEIVQKVSKTPLREFIKKEIFLPLDMSESLLYSQKRNDSMTNRVYGFRSSGIGNNRLFDQHILGGMSGDGSIYSTVSDLLKYEQALYTEKLVPYSMLEEAFSPVVMNDGSTYEYGYGLGTKKNKHGEQIVHHGGRFVGFVSRFHRNISKKRFIVILTNNTSDHTKSFLNGTISILDNEQYDYPKLPYVNIFYKSLSEKGYEFAEKEYYLNKEKHPDKYDFSERSFNGLGYTLIRNNDLKHAIKVFELNMKEHPNSANTYDSLAESYLKNKDQRNAIKYYKQALKLDPSMQSARKALIELGEDVPKLEQNIQLSKSFLKKYEGSYKINDRVTIKVVSDNNKLLLKIADRPYMDLVPVSKTKFRSEITDLQIDFGINKNDKIDKVLAIRNGNGRVANKLTANN